MATVERLASGGYSYQIEEWYNSAAAERALGSLDPPACSSRPRLKAPAEWIHGERLKFDENLSGLFKEREVRFGTDDNDDFDLTSIEPSSSLPVCAGRMLHATVAFNRIGNARAPGSRSRTRAILARPDAALHLCKRRQRLDGAAAARAQRQSGPPFRDKRGNTATCSCCPGPHQLWCGTCWTTEWISNNRARAASQHPAGRRSSDGRVVLQVYDV